MDSLVSKQTDTETYFSCKMNTKAGGKHFGKFKTANLSYLCAGDNVYVCFCIIWIKSRRRVIIAREATEPFSAACIVESLAKN